MRVRISVFTGSLFTVRPVAEACAPLLIPSVLELGMKRRILVLGDAIWSCFPVLPVWGSYTNCGQVCLSCERSSEHRSDVFYPDIAEKRRLPCVSGTIRIRNRPVDSPRIIASG